MTQGEVWRALDAIGWHLLGLASNVRAARVGGIDWAGVARDVRGVVGLLERVEGECGGYDAGGRPVEQDGVPDGDCIGGTGAAQGADALLAAGG